MAQPHMTRRDHTCSILAQIHVGGKLIRRRAELEWLTKRGSHAEAWKPQRERRGSEFGLSPAPAAESYAG
jgi:hypothetical protein